MALLNNIINFWEAAGWVAPALAILSIISWYWMFAVFFRLKKSCQRSADFESEIAERLINNESSEDIRSSLQNRLGIIPRITAYVLQAHGQSTAILRDRFLEARMVELLPLRRELFIIKNLVKAAPLLGLLGTVIGMIETFGALSLSSASSSIVASGISKSLLTTQMGMIIALPGLFVWQYLDSLYRSLVQIITALEYQLISVMKNGDTP